MTVRTPSRRRGFTLVEQAAVVALAGAALASLLPVLAALRPEAERVALQTQAGVAGRAMALNELACAVTDQRPVPGKCARISRCEQVAELLGGELPEGVRAAPQAIADGLNGVAVRCQLQGLRDDLQAVFRGVSAGH